MIGSRQVIAIVPARGGSKGIPRKNLALVGGRTLLERAVAIARDVPLIDRIVVSTDDDEIARVARAAGAEVHQRPPHLATDTSKVIETLWHICETLLDPAGAGDAMLVLLEPTCPLRTPHDVTECIEALAAGGDCVATFTPAATNPWRAWRIADGRPQHFIADANPWLPRQQLPPAFELTGAVYAFWRDNLRDPRNEVLCGDIRAVILPPERSLDIDTVRDLHVAESLLKESNR